MGSSLLATSRTRVLVLLASWCTASMATSDPSQVEVLRGLMSWGGPIISSWGSTSDPCSQWQGVSCNVAVNPAIVTGLNLRNGGLQGTLPASLFTLTSLTLLNLGYNPLLGGTIPDAFTSLSNLVTLSLQSCSFSGTLPSSVGAMPSLIYLSVRQNNLGGALPATLTSLSLLTWFDITTNQFSGPLPEGMSNITTLKHLHMSFNNLTSMPEGFAKLPMLEHLLIDNNQVKQPLPDGLLSMPSIQIIQLSNNSFSLANSSFLTGSAPYLLEVGAHRAFNISLPLLLPDYANSSLPRLQLLDLGENYGFVGPLPASISILKDLITLDLQWNKISGVLPLSLQNLTKLELLNLNNNIFNGYLGDLTGHIKDVQVHLENNLISEVALSNLNPTNETFTSQVFLFGNPVCSGSNVAQCLPFSCNQTWENRNMTELCGEDVQDKCRSLTLSVPGGLFLPSPAVYYGSSTSKQCQCASPLRAHLFLNYTAFPTFTDARALDVQFQTVKALQGPRWKIQLQPEQVVVSEASRGDSCGTQFLLTVDFFPDTQGNLDTLGIQNFLTSSPGYLDQSEFGLQYVQDFILPAELPSSGGLTTGQIVGIVLGCVFGVAILLGIVAFVVYKRTKRRGGPPDWWSDEDYKALNELVNAVGVTRFTLASMKEATNNFSPECRLGEGGYGEVYKGVLPENAPGGGTVVAVKRAKPAVQQGGEEFRNEIELLSRVRHRNLVELKGFCREEGEQLLAYEFVSQGTLDEWIFGDDDRSPLSWEQRVSMALGAARGLAYLHYDIKPTIIHRDIKPGNILIDSDFNAKVADFGLSKSVPEGDEERGLETKIKGTAGFLDPEYYLTDLLTEKSDVYAFGIVLLELGTGQQVFHGNTHIRNRVCKQVSEHGIMSVLDPRLKLSSHPLPDPLAFEAFLRLAMQCCTKKATARPNMHEIEAVLVDVQTGGLQRRSSLDSAAPSSHTDPLFNVEEEVDINLPSSDGGYGSSAAQTTGGGFSEQSGAFVGPDGELYEGAGDALQSGVVAK